MADVCTFKAPGTYCGIGVTINPFDSPGPFDSGTSFQSQEGSGASAPITIDFSKPVSSFVITVYDPDFLGNRIVAYDQFGIPLDSVAVQHDNQPGVYSERTVTITREGISRCILVPAPLDYVGYSDVIISPGTVCLPVGEPVMDAAGMVKSMLDLLAQSRPNANGTGRKEMGALIYVNTDGSYGLAPINDPTATDCGFTVNAAYLPTLPAGASTIGVLHTHPSKGGERLYGCQGLTPGQVAFASRNPKAGGGSPPDWAAADTSGIPQYVINLDKRMARLDPLTPQSQWATNPYQWFIDPTTRCLKH